MADQILNQQTLVASAIATTGLSDFGEDTWQEGLERLLHALIREGNLSAIGAQVAAATIGDQLTTRLHVTDWHARFPEIGDAPVPPAVVILGQPRTGTTILFDLLAQDPQFRVPLTWEVATPSPPPETATYLTDARIAEAQARVAMSEFLIPGFQAIHPSGAQRAQECVAITAGDFRSLLFPTVYHVPSYARWLLWEADMAPAYRYHRRFLQLLQWRHPGNRWLLKTPGHQWCLEALFNEYPDASIIHTHRDPLKVLASVASLTANLQLMATETTSVPMLASEWVDYLVEGNDRSVAARQDGTVPDGAAVDVAFASLMDDTFGVISSIYQQLGLELTDETQGRMRSFLRENPSDKHGTHAYTFSATELDVAAVRERTARYEQFFDVPRESLG